MSHCSLVIDHRVANRSFGTTLCSGLAICAIRFPVELAQMAMPNHR